MRHLESKAAKYTEVLVPNDSKGLGAYSKYKSKQEKIPSPSKL